MNAFKKPLLAAIAVAMVPVASVEAQQGASYIEISTAANFRLKCH